MSSHIPDDLIPDILLLLPSKSLLRCRSVCKSWLSLISSNKFKFMHLHKFNQRNPRNLLRRLEWRENKEVYSVHFDDETLTIDLNIPIEFPFHRNHDTMFYFRIVGCCNGVVCLSDDKCESREDQIILWNPSIRRKINLIPPKLRVRDLEELSLVFGFGYDKISDDYKVIRLAYKDCPSSTRPQVEVYTVKTAIWREIRFPQDFPSFSILPIWLQVFFNGFVHWITCRWTDGISHCSIMTFDINTENFAELQLPKYLTHESALNLEVAIMREHLAVIYSRRIKLPHIGPSYYTVWAMEEYKNPASWTVIYNMHCPHIDMGRVLRLRNNGDMIMGSSYGDLIIRNRRGEYYVYASGTMFVIEDSTDIDIYQESLALLDVGQGL